MIRCRCPNHRFPLNSRVHDSSMLVAPNAPSKAHEDGGPMQTITTSLAGQALRQGSLCLRCQPCGDHDVQVLRGFRPRCPSIPLLPFRVSESMGVDRENRVLGLG
ncbi:hypothetical protein Taro_017225 [Colocasia esculenta]|uniref:Uncharacterized protein n=1 Tax=Colocasia esculenta TaxID=4460 RepID=A0A843UMI2_COLES|nr:hypothetical protein [Colocasia esculenta]